MESRIPVADVDVGELEERYVLEAIRSSWISSAGHFIDRFEQEFAAACGARHALCCSNGTVALHLALAGLGLRPGDEVIVPSLTYISSVNAIRYCGAEPVFVDIDPATWCISPDGIEQAITPRTRGIVAVHLLGHPADMDRINRIAQIHGLWVVEDAAEAHFARQRERTVGSLGTIGTFSFFGNKIFTCGEGGAITFNNSDYYERLHMLRGQGMCPERRYYFPIVGFNFRLTNVAAAMLCAQLERREEIMRQRKRVYQWYRQRLASVPGVKLQPVAEWAEPAPWLFSVLIDPVEFGCNRDNLMTILARQGIDSRPFFHPIHTMPPYRSSFARAPHCMEVTDRVARQGIMLPTFNRMTEQQVERVCNAIAMAQRANGSLRRVA